MDAQSFVSKISVKTPVGWRLTWHGDNDSLSARDENGLVVFASIPDILFSSHIEEDVLVDRVLEATEERIEWCKSWDILKSRAFVSIRDISALTDDGYQQNALWIGGELAAVVSASLDSHMTLLPDATLRLLGVPAMHIWAQAVRNLERWYRTRTWEVTGPPRHYVSLEDDPVHLVTDPEQKSSSLAAKPQFIAQIANEYAIFPVCFAVPAEGTLLFGKDTPAGRFAVSGIARTMAATARREGMTVLSSEVFRIGPDGGPVTTQPIH